MVQALEVVHGNGLVHLDIKPENIFTRAGQYKLGDFGLCRNGKGERHVEEGDSRYMSMELLNDDYRSLEKSDIFSLGCTLYEVCRCEPLPFSGQEWQDIRGGVLRGESMCVCVCEDEAKTRG